MPVSYYNLQPIFAGAPTNIVKPYLSIKHSCSPGKNLDGGSDNGVLIFDPSNPLSCSSPISYGYRLERLRVVFYPAVLVGGIPAVQYCDGGTPKAKVFLIARYNPDVNGAIVEEKLLPSVNPIDIDTVASSVEFVFDGGLVLANCVSLYLSQTNASSNDYIFSVYGEISSLDFIDYGI